MSTRSQTSDSLYSRESFAGSFAEVDNWIGSHNDERTAAVTTDFNQALTAEIHAAISSNSSEYAASVCDQLFTLYRDVQQRSFVLQFLPSFIVAYYDVLHRQHDESNEAIAAKDVCSTIDTFLVGLYNLGVLDDGYSEKAHEFRIPNLTIPSIYHTPNPDHYAPTPLTQHAISKHEKRCEVVRMPTFMPFDSVNATSSHGLQWKIGARNLHYLFVEHLCVCELLVWTETNFCFWNNHSISSIEADHLPLLKPSRSFSFREQILWFLLIQYGLNVSSMNSLSRQAYLKMTRKLIGQGFSFDEKPPANAHTSPLPPTGRRIHVSSRIMSEILGTLSYFKASSIDHDASECMRLVKQRAEYEMYTDVILMTESMGYLHEFETQRPEQQDPIGIEIELPPTIEMVKQKRSATTTRSMKNRHRPHKTHHQHETAIVENDLPNETIEHITFVPAPSDADPTALTPPTSHRHRSIHDVLEEKSPTTEFIRSNSLHASLAGEQHSEESTPLMVAETNSHIASSIGPATSSPSPSSARHYRSLTSTQTYFQSIQQQGSSSPNMQHVQTLVYHDNGSPRPRTSSMKHSDKKETHTTVRFVGADEQTSAPETFL